jgi:hypothetical protein
VSPGVTGTASGSAQRHGEPFGELALVTPKDAASHDQHGGPRDPQAGNTGGQAVDKVTQSTTTITSAPAGTTSSTSTTTTTTTTTLQSGSTTTTPPTTTTTTSLNNGQAKKQGSSAATAQQVTPAMVKAATPSIDWHGTSSSITTLPWAQGTQSKPSGLSLPTFDMQDDDDDLIDWTGAHKSAKSATRPAISASSTTKK